MSDKPFDTGQYVTVKEFISMAIQPMERDMIQIRSSMEKMANSQINSHDLESLKLQVSSLSEGMQDLEKRLMILEQHDNVTTWIFRIVTGIGTALLIGWLGSVFR